MPVDCTLGSDFNRSAQLRAYASDQPWLLAWWQTWDRLRSAFGLVVAYESSHMLRFEWVVRLRPDAWFFRPGFAFCTLNPADGVVTPSGIAGCSAPCINDHLAWIPRQFADGYFDAAEELENCHDPSVFLRRMRDYGHFLYHRLLRRGVRVAPARLVPYTLARPCSSFHIDAAAVADCNRIGHDSGAHPGGKLLMALESTREWHHESIAECVKQWTWPPGVPAGGSPRPHFNQVC